MRREASPPAHPELHSLAAILSAKKIRTVAVIDDAYDRRTSGDLLTGEAGRFWSRIEFDEEARSSLNDHGITIESRLDIEQDDAILQRLWDLRSEQNTLGAAIREELFPIAISQMEFLDGLERYLSERLGLEVITSGRDIDVEKFFGDKEIQFVFLDYLLDPGAIFSRSIESSGHPIGLDATAATSRDLNAASESSRDIATRIYDCHRGREMPLVILMSNASAVHEGSTYFRRKSKLLAGMFYVVHKDELADENKIFLHIGVWAKALPLGADLQTFVNIIDTSITKAWRRFISGVKELSIEDYQYIQRLSLQEEDQPLGDYMIGLYSAYLGHLLFENNEALQAQRKLVDKIKVIHPPPMTAMPSPRLVKMYHNALFDLEGTKQAGYGPDEEELEENSEDDVLGASDAALEVTFGEPSSIEPEDKTEEQILIEKVMAPEPSDEGTDGGTLPHEDEYDLLDLYEAMYCNSGSVFHQHVSSLERQDLHLGDVFIRERDKSVLMIINAECDLVTGENRTCEPDDAVYFLPGKLQPLNERVKDADKKKKRTELFALGGESYRIIWDVKKVTSRTFARVRISLHDSDYVWRARLRQPYAIDLQRAFAADITRVGVPVAPPIYQPIKIQFFRRKDGGDCKRVTRPLDDLGVLVIKGDKARCYPTAAFSHKLREVITALLRSFDNRLQNRRGATDGLAKKEQNRIGQQAADLRKFNARFEAWFYSLEEIKLPAIPGKIETIAGTPLGVSWGLQSGDKAESKSTLLVLDIIGMEGALMPHAASKTNKQSNLQVSRRNNTEESVSDPGEAAEGRMQSTDSEALDQGPTPNSQTEGSIKS